jgi:hypothetical protein
VVAHNEYFGSAFFNGPLVELECPAIEPARARLLVVVEAEPNVFELTDLRIVLAPTQINDVGYPQGL